MGHLGELFEIPSQMDLRGNIAFFEPSILKFPFSIERVYYLFGVPDDEVRGEHAHFDLDQVLIALNGSFSVALEQNGKTENINLNCPKTGLIIRPGTWRRLSCFSANAVCLVLASDVYRESDYIRSYSNFLALTESGRWIE